jgi:hypothetical protein
MDKEKAAQRTLEKRAGELWFGAKVETALPTPVPAVVLITTQEPPDAAYNATHFIKSTEHYVSAEELLQVATDGSGLTDDQGGALLAGLIGTRHALAPLVDRLSGTDEWSAALTYARHVLGLPLMNLEPEIDLVHEQEHA